MGEVAEEAEDVHDVADGKGSTSSVRAAVCESLPVVVGRANFE